MINHHLAVSCCILLQQMLCASSHVWGCRTPDCGFPALEQVFSLVACTLLLLIKDVRGIVLNLEVLAGAALATLVIATTLGRTCAHWRPSRLQDINMVASWGFSIGVLGAVHAMQPRKTSRVHPSSALQGTPAGANATDYAHSRSFHSVVMNSERDRVAEQVEAAMRACFPQAHADGTKSNCACACSGTKVSRARAHRHVRSPRRSATSGSFGSSVAAVHSPSPESASATSLAACDAAVLDGLYDDMANGEVLDKLEDELQGVQSTETDDDDILLA